MTAGRAAMVRLIHWYSGARTDHSIPLPDVHRLMYLMQSAGEPLRLKYARHHHGPYAENLRHVLPAVEGHLITGYAGGDDSPARLLRLVPGAVADATAFLDRSPGSRARLERVRHLVAGFESSDGLELLSTVHWVMTHEGAHHPDDVVARIQDWNPRRRRQFSRRQIGLAMHRLQEQRWTEAGCRFQGGNGHEVPTQAESPAPALTPGEKNLAQDWLPSREDGTWAHLDCLAGFQPRTAPGRKLVELRQSFIAQGGQRLPADGLDAEIRARRGGISPVQAAEAIAQAPASSVRP